MDDRPDQHPPVVPRFAPSPTGHLHIGGARTALFCRAFARRHGGRFLLRIEDTDQKRSSEDAARGILEDLAWLGIGWDEGPEHTTADGRTLGGDPRGVGPFFQSQRREIYDAAFDRLLAAGLAYPAFDTPEELAAARKAAEAQKRSFVYRRPADADAEAALRRMAGETHVLRFRMPAEPVTVVDDVLGEVTFPYEELDDLVIRKADGFPTYHFACVVDDAAMGVTHVLRGQEHLNNTPRHVALQKALGLPTPAYAHLPLIFNPDGSKMSKRDKDKAARAAAREAGLDAPPSAAVDSAEFADWLEDKSRQLGREQLAALAAALALSLPEIDVEDFRAAGYLPEAVCNFIALLGWNPGQKNDDGTDLERFDDAYLDRTFDTARVGKTASKFDRDKLAAFNADTIQHDLTDEAFAARWLAWAERFDPRLAAWAHEDHGRWTIAARAARPRARTLRDARGPIAFALASTDEIEYDDKAVKKALRKGEPSGANTLPAIRDAIAAADPWGPDAIDAAVAAHAESTGLGMGKVAQPLRVAITGTAVSPPLGETLALLTRDEALARIDRCIAEHPAGAER